jgi:hypothetical protein
MNPAIQLIEEYRQEIIDTDIDRHRAAAIRAKLSALYGNVNEWIRETEMVYNKKFAETLALNDSVAKSEVLSKVTTEYTNFKTARDTEKVLLEMIRSLKHIIDVKDNEWFEGTH